MNKYSLILPSSLSRYSSAPKTKIIVIIVNPQILRVKHNIIVKLPKICGYQTLLAPVLTQALNVSLTFKISLRHTVVLRCRWEKKIECYHIFWFEKNKKRNVLSRVFWCQVWWSLYVEARFWVWKKNQIIKKKPIKYPAFLFCVKIYKRFNKSKTKNRHSKPFFLGCLAEEVSE